MDKVSRLPAGQRHGDSITTPKDPIVRLGYLSPEDYIKRRKVSS